MARNAYAWVSTNSSWALRPWANNHAGGNVTVLGATAAPVGAAICRSGATTGFRCGTVAATNVGINYGQGMVNGLVRSTACAGRGDSGGAFITAAGQAQGVTSGGVLPAGANDNCGEATPVTYHQPIQPILLPVQRRTAHVRPGAGRAVWPATGADILSACNMRDCTLRV